MASPRLTRRVAAIAGALFLLGACGPSDGDVDEDAAIDPQAVEEPEDDADPEPEPPQVEREPLYYPASELFLPHHELDGLEVDFFATLNTLDETVEWFERNVENLDEFTITDEVVNGERLWIAERADAAPGEVVRIEIADSDVHGDQGSMAEVADVIPPGAVIIAISYVP